MISFFYFRKIKNKDLQKIDLIFFPSWNIISSKIAYSCKFIIFFLTITCIILTRRISLRLTIIADKSRAILHGWTNRFINKDIGIWSVDCLKASLPF